MPFTKTELSKFIDSKNPVSEAPQHGENRKKYHNYFK
jgi:hypothetical protein